MTSTEIQIHPAFRGFCRAWQDGCACPLALTDLLIEEGLVGQAEGARWAAAGYDGVPRRLFPRRVRDGAGGFAWGDNVPRPVRDAMPAVRADLPTLRGGATFEAAVAALLDAWAVAGLSFEQMAAANTLLSGVGSKPVRTAGGFAGTGKSRLLSHLHAALPRFAVCAFTGKAADVLRRKGVATAATIHGTIYRPVKEGTRVRFVRKLRDELGCDGFLIDEASMVSADIFADLMRYELPIVAVGDHGQLPPVGADAGLMREPDVTLETVHRNAGPVARFAEHLRKGGVARDWPGGGGVWVGGEVPGPTLLAADQVICAYNRTRVGLNRELREAKSASGQLFPHEDARPRPGDRVICTRNDRLVGVFNGQQGTVEDVDHAGRWMTFHPDGSDTRVEVNYHPDGFHSVKGVKDESRRPGQDVPFDYAYCVTAHKAQGDEWQKVVVIEQRCDLWDHARWAYTAASRARDALVWVAEG